MKKLPGPLFGLILLLFSTACAQQAAQLPAKTITVMAAASLSNAFQEMGERFQQQHPDVKIVFNFSGSQQLAQQLAQGAAADVFASANLQQMEQVVENGRIRPGGYQVFAQNRLVLVTPKENPGALSTWQDLAKPGIKLVFAAREVPAGQYSLEFLEKASQNTLPGPAFQEAVQNNIVSYEDSVKAVLAKIVLGEADAGIVYTTDLAGSAAEQVMQIPIPEPLNVIASYPIGVLEDSPNPEQAQAFVDFVQSPQGQEILARYGFLPAEK